jgi:hypothetical protein
MTPVEVGTILLWAVFWLFMNPLRGGQFKSDIPFGKAIPSDLMASLFFAGVLALTWGNPTNALIVAVAYKIGESFGWTRWLWAFDPRMTQERYNTEPHKEAPKGWAKQWEWGSTLADKIIDPTKNWIANAYLGFGIRSLLWWAPVYGAMAFLSVIAVPTAVAATLAASFLQPLCYHFAASTFAREMANWLKGAEYCYGLFYGLVFGLALVL